MQWIGSHGVDKDRETDTTLGAAAASLVRRTRQFAQQQLERILAPVARLLRSAGVTANQLSTVGVGGNLVAAVLVVAGEPVIAGGVYLVAGLLDMLDGMVARLAGSATRFGAFLDSTLDRISEGLVLAAIAYHFATHADPVHAGMAGLALASSFLVSYTRARAEGLGGECKVGMFARPERVIVLALGLLTGWLAEAIYVLLLLTAVTVAQRIAHVRNELEGESPGAD